MTSQRNALVLLSGGQDSTTCLYWAIDRFGSASVASVSFDYGQRHRIELECAATIAAHVDVPHRCLPIDTFAALGGNALTDAALVPETGVAATDDLPNTFVPGRNLVFLTLAAAYAYQRGITELVTGVAQTDYSGYPDCREDTMTALQQSLRLGMEHPVTIHAPLMHRSKKETVQLAETLDAIDAMAMTHTCYNGERPPCQQCAACELRARGFAEAGIADPLLPT
ncbi:MAG: 7-cyano-7-deazaguanine synthase QueC [Gammaproteobacteria bacterium]|nr:7-cyano-7-deazaguanine synthase QueC [Gammaproteobacteria bacterium]